MREAIDEAAKSAAAAAGSVLFIDEIHRFNKAQQDALLHAVEQGTVTLIGATTENPSFEVNAALLSRVRGRPAATLRDEIGRSSDRALADQIARPGRPEPAIPPETSSSRWPAGSEGDARVALTTLEEALLATPPLPPTARAGHRGRTRRGPGPGPLRL